MNHQIKVLKFAEGQVIVDNHCHGGPFICENGDVLRLQTRGQVHQRIRHEIVGHGNSIEAVPKVRQELGPNGVLRKGGEAQENQRSYLVEVAGVRK